MPPSHPPKRTRSSSPPITWTAPRCMRLVRALSARINTLRRAARQAPQAPRPAPRHAHTVAWMPMPPADPRTRPPAMRIYSRPARRHRAARNAPTPVDAESEALRTPAVRRIVRASPRARDPSPPPPQLPLPGPSRTRRVVAVRGCTALEEAERDVVLGVRAFLLATQAVPEAEARRGPRSLLAMCQRAVPACIAQEEQTAREEEGEEQEWQGVGTVAATYAWLEELGTCAGAGWSGLRTVVRAHGMEILSGAVREGFVSRAVAGELLQVCWSCGAVEEGRALWRARFVGSDRVFSCEDEQDLLGWGEGDGGREFQLRFLRELLVGRHLSEHRVRKQGLWHGLLAFVVGDSTREDCMALLASRLVTLIRLDAVDGGAARHGTQPGDSLLEVAAVLSTFILRGESRGRGVELRKCLKQLVFTTLDACPVAADGRVQVAPCLRPFLLSVLVNQAARPQAFDIDVASVVALLTEHNGPPASRSSPLPDTPDARFVCQMAKTYAHADLPAADVTLRAAVKGLLESSRDMSGPRAEFLRDVALRGAMAWAEHRDEPGCYRFVEDVEQSLAGGTDAGATRYRWEEGLCEWIVATPVAPAAPHRNPSPESDVGDSRICMAVNEKAASKRPRPSDREDKDLDELMSGTPLAMRRGTQVHKAQVEDAQKPPKRVRQLCSQTCELVEDEWTGHEGLSDVDSEDELAC